MEVAKAHNQNNVFAGYAGSGAATAADAAAGEQLTRKYVPTMALRMAVPPERAQRWRNV